jgi:hypothetical protein
MEGYPLSSKPSELFKSVTDLLEWKTGHNVVVEPALAAAPGVK